MYDDPDYHDGRAIAIREVNIAMYWAQKKGYTILRFIERPDYEECGIEWVKGDVREFTNIERIKRELKINHDSMGYPTVPEE